MAYPARLVLALLLSVSLVACASRPAALDAPAAFTLAGPELSPVWSSAPDLRLAGGLVQYRHGPLRRQLYAGLADAPGLVMLDAVDGRLERRFDQPPHHDTLAAAAQIVRAQRVLFWLDAQGTDLRALIVPGMRPLVVFQEHIPGLEVRGLWVNAREALHFDAYLATPLGEDDGEALTIRRVEVDLRNLRRPRVEDGGLLGQGALTGSPRIGGLLGGDPVHGRLLAVPESRLARQGILSIDADTGITALIDEGFADGLRPISAALRECTDGHGVWVFAAEQGGEVVLHLAARESFAMLGRAIIPAAAGVHALATAGASSDSTFDGLFVLDRDGRVHALDWRQLLSALPGLPAACA